MLDLPLPYKFSQIYLSSEVREDEIARRVLQRLSHIPAEIVEDEERFRVYLASLSLSEGKRILWLTRFRGQFLKSCPGTQPPYRCCNYLVINETTNCPIDCSYCILQGYINNPAITIYTNYQKIVEEMERLSRANPHRILRMGTGELTDSLALDPLTELSGYLMESVQHLPNVLLELKSKTAHVQHLFSHPHQRVVLSWSVNPEKIIVGEEHKSETLLGRLKAARQAAERGFLIGLHFDPIIYLPDWEPLYRELIRQIAEYVPATRIAWISMGSFRYPPHLQEVIRTRFPRTRIFSGEQVPGMDGKMRYLRPLRQQMYRTIYQEIRSLLGEVFVYFCMEDQPMWEAVLHRAPRSSNDVDWYFATSLSQRFPELALPVPRPEVYQTPIIFPEEETVPE